MMLVDFLALENESLFFEVLTGKGNLVHCMQDLLLLVGFFIVLTFLEQLRGEKR
jgi:hypothetical protein